MPIDDRIRDGLARNADVPPPPVEHHLDRVRVRRRRRLQVRVALAAAAVVVAVMVPWALVAGVELRHVDSAASRAPQLPGTYRVVVGSEGASAGVEGTWTVTLVEDGAVVLDPPTAYEGPVGESYELSGAAEITTNLFVGSPGCQRADPPVGVYRFTVTDAELRFSRVDDTCPARVRLLAEPWERLP